MNKYKCAICGHVSADIVEAQDHVDYDHPTVDLIASGYEWICPNCDAFHHLIEATDKVTCDSCHKTYEVDEVYHAIP